MSTLKAGLRLPLALMSVAALAACSSNAGASTPAPTSAVASAQPSSQSATNHITNVRLAYVPLYTAGVIKLAQDLGYFDEAHLNVTLVPVSSPAAGTAALTGSSADVAYSTSIQLVRNLSNGIVLRVVAPADGYDPSLSKDAKNNPALQSKLDDTALVAGATSGITSVRDLPGKLVAVPATGGQLEVTIASSVRAAGGDPKKINWVIVTLPESIALLKRGEIDAAGLVSPFTSQGEEIGGHVIAYPGYEFFGNEPVSGLWLTTASFADQNAQAVRELKAALVKANLHAMANPDEFYAAAAAMTNSTPAEVKAQSAPYFPASVTEQDFSGVAKRMLDEGEGPEPVDVSGVIIQ